jgi:hypothetical protein
LPLLLCLALFILPILPYSTLFVLQKSTKSSQCTTS